MTSFLRNRILNNIQKHGQDAGAPPAVNFDEKSLVTDGGDISVVGNWLSRLLDSNGFFLSLPPDVYGVAIHPDGSIREMQGGLHIVPPGLYRIKYVSKLERIVVIPSVGEMTTDGENISFGLLVQYHVKNPVTALHIENPVPALIEYIESDVAQYIRTHSHDQIMEAANASKIDALFSFLNEKHLNRRLMSDAIALSGIEIRELVGDASFIDLRYRRSLEHSQKSNRNAGELQHLNIELERKIAEDQALITRLSAELMSLLSQKQAEHKENTPLNSAKEEVSFTAYHPKEGSIGTWHTLLVYTHAFSAMAKVREDAKRFEHQTKESKETISKSSVPIARGTELTIVPVCEGITFNPERISFRWIEDFHRADFRFNADKSLSGDAAKGSIDIYVGPLIIGTLKFAMLFNDANAETQPVPDHEEQSKMYGKDDVFISYSRKDSEVARTFKTVLEGTGLDVFLDVDDIRSGQLWEDELKRRIERAQIFQIFWSANYSQSENCKQEWNYALKQNKEEGYIRPVFWEKPLSPRPPDELNKFNFKYVELKEANGE